MMEIAPAKEIFVYAYFKGHGDGLHLAASTDGYRWEALNNDRVFLRPEVGIEKILRDPCIVQGPDRQFHLVWTSGWNEKGIGYASSPDLVHWSEQVCLPVMEHEAKARNCWAPEIIYDPLRKLYMIYWSSTVEGNFPETQAYGDDGYNHRIYCMTTPDFKKFSETKLLYDPGFNVIDANIVRDNGQYLMFMKNETLVPPQKNIRMATGNDMLAFGTAGPPLSLNHYWAEGPSALKVKDHWLVYFDKYKINEIGALRSYDLMQWEDVSHAVVFPKGAQHGYAFTAAEPVIARAKKTLATRNN